MTRQRIAELFDQAVELPADEREAWIAAVCAGDADLLERLSQLVQADTLAARFLEKSPAITPGAATAEPVEDMPRQFGPYRVLRRIGVGGMGDVWLAERSDGHFEHRVAVKQLAYPTPGLLHRFRQERQILARLDHANIAHLIDGGVDEADAPYIVMEFVEGSPITTHVREHDLDLRARLEMFLAVCDGVQYAHQNLVVHRDLKPSNIFVTADGVPKLLDFGIAKVLAGSDESAPTQTFARMLTPDYAAPEQFSGAPVTTATDVYSLGVVLYELLADTRPPRSMPMHAGDHGMTEPPPPSAAIDRTTGNARRRALRGDLDRIVLTALAHEPQRRYSSAEALASDIRHYLAGRPIAARGDKRWYRFRKFARRNRYALAAAVIAFGISIAAAFLSLQQAHLAREQAQRAQAVRKFLVGVFEQAHPDQNKGQPFTAQQLLAKGEQQLATATDMNPAIRAELTGLIGSLYWKLSDNTPATKLLADAIAWNADPRVPDEVKARNLLAQATMEIDSRLPADSLAHASEALRFALSSVDGSVDLASQSRYAMGLAYIRNGDSSRARAIAQEALDADIASFGESHENVAADWSLLGNSLDELGRYDESKKAFTKGIAIWIALRGEQSLELGNAYNDLGLMLLHSGDLAGAESAQRKTLAIAEQLAPDGDDTRTARSNLIRAIELQGRYAEALTQRLDLLDKAKKKVSETRPDALAFAYNFISADYRELGRFAEAEAASRESLAIWGKLQGSNDSVDSSAPLTNLGMVLSLRGQYDEAKAAFERAVTIQQKTAPPSSQWLNLSRAGVGTALRLQHRHADALRELTQASEATKANAGEANPWLAGLQAQLSEAQLDAGDARAAEATAAAALAVDRRVLPIGNFRFGPPLFALARAKLALGKASEAEPLLREALAVGSPPHPDDDPRILEVKVGLVNALRAQDKHGDATRLAVTIEPLLAASTSPYAADLRARLATD
jgi:tetratricopeptide (TPR) repeat protein